jgi:dihydroneopterin aldolase / 2-amino-4-hydroxy-6-hydroxymethyldihydropteridine diphosphokinase
LQNKDKITLTGLKVRCIIGIFDWERKQKQDVLIDMQIPTNARKAASRDNIADATDYKKIAKATIAFVEKSRFLLIETLVEQLAGYLLSRFNLKNIFLRVSKPGAVRGSQNVGIEITRESSDQMGGLVYLSLGSNIEPKTHLANALKEIDRAYGLNSISHVYETSPVGGEKNQPFFWNMVVGIETNEIPEKIRKWIADLEKKEGRTKANNRYNSRTLDIDLILWKNRVIKSKNFSLPHPDVRTKAFVLFPLLEIAPRLVLPGSSEPLIELAHCFNDKSQAIRQLTINL